MTTREKKWYWALTFPVAHANYTTVWNTLYCPAGRVPSAFVLAHEEIHSKQQHAWGWFLLPAWIFCYLFVMPILWNPFRKKWELEAFVDGSKYTQSAALAKLRTYKYGWLL